eukprot:2343829-Pleurochrysis_carterae.AAC.4
MAWGLQKESEKSSEENKKSGLEICEDKGRKVDEERGIGRMNTRWKNEGEKEIHERWRGELAPQEQLRRDLQTLRDPRRLPKFRSESSTRAPSCGSACSRTAVA